MNAVTVYFQHELRGLRRRMWWRERGTPLALAFLSLSLALAVLALR